MFARGLKRRVNGNLEPSDKCWIAWGGSAPVDIVRPRLFNGVEEVCSYDAGDVQSIKKKDVDAQKFGLAISLKDVADTHWLQVRRVCPSSPSPASAMLERPWTFGQPAQFIEKPTRDGVAAALVELGAVDMTLLSAKEARPPPLSLHDRPAPPRLSLPRVLHRSAATPSLVRAGAHIF